MVVAVDSSAVIATLKAFVVDNIAGLQSVEQVGDASDLAALGLDSMSALNLLLDIEEEFAVQFPEAYLTAEVFRTPMTLADAIASLGQH